MTPPPPSPGPVPPAPPDARHPAVPPILDDDASAVVAFWRSAGPARWFSKDEAFDRQFRERFLHMHEAAAQQQLDHWMTSAEGSLALLILLDQFPRNAFRGTARMYATDPLALHIARRSIGMRLDSRVAAELRLFFYLPLSHAENRAYQSLAVELNRSLGQPWLSHAEDHLRIIERFGRFPHRNPLLGRTTTLDEQAFLDQGGFAG